MKPEGQKPSQETKEITDQINRAWDCYHACAGMTNPAEAIEGLKRALRRALISAEASYQDSNLATAIRAALREAGEGEV